MEPEYHGSLVAFEGSPDIVSTQLRLLPTSPQILALPSVHKFMEETPSERPFDPRSFIRRVHEASVARRKLAVDFLKHSSSSDKRLVFLNGGTVSAHTLCVTAIRQHQGIDGLAESEAIFCELVKDGLGGLVAPGSKARPNREERGRGGFVEAEDPITKAMRAADALDKMTESLQQSNILDLEIKPRSRSLSLPIYGYADPLMESTPFYMFGASAEDTLPLHNFPDVPGKSRDGAGTKEPPKLRGSLRDSPSEAARLSTRKIQAHPPSYSRSPGTLSPLPLPSEGFDRSPTSPGPVVIEQAEVIDMGLLNDRTGLRRARSLDRLFHPKRAQRARLVYGGSVSDKETAGATDSDSNPPGAADERRHSWLGVPGGSGAAPRRRPSHLDLRRAVVCKASQTTIQRSTSRRVAGGARARYADKGTGTEAADLASSRSAAEDAAATPSSAEPVLPLVEDLIIHFTGDTHHALFESIMQGFKAGVYPVSSWPAPPSASDGRDTADLPHTPTTPVSPMFLNHHHHTKNGSSGSSNKFSQHQKQDSSLPSGDCDEYDPFRPLSTSFKNSAVPTTASSSPPPPLPTRKHMAPKVTALVTALEPPTPAQTPPPPPSITQTGDSSKFRHFSLTGKRTAVCVQNSLRSLLSGYFPPEDQGYHQCHFPLLPDMAELWRPVFGEAEPGSPRHRKRKLDLILAIGGQKGVNKEFLSSLTAQIEKLGTKPAKGHLTRTGRLDLRYLIANAMQSFTSQPLANQTQDNPFTNPTLLATLIVPHLETYLAAHAGVRFLLLDYPSDHLATVLALQKLVGVDVLKVAGIISNGANGPEPISFSPRAPPSAATTRAAAAATGASSPESKDPASAAAVSTTTTGEDGASTKLSSPGALGRAKSNTLQALQSFAVAAETLSFSKANFLLTASATDSEIATFISTIWKILIDVSDFYIPQHLPKQQPLHQPVSRSVASPVPQKPLPPLVPGQFNSSNAHASIGGIISPPLSPPDIPAIPTGNAGGGGAATPRALRSTSPAPSTRSRVSVASAKTSRTARSVRSRLRALNGASRRGDTGPAAESIFDYDPADDSDYDFEERRLMPLYMTRGRARKGNSRKALKWLGLA